MRARSLAYGRRRAARRVRAGGFVPHPGWRHRVPAGQVVLTDQAAALARVEELVDAELWRADRRAVALAVLRGLVCGMSWDSGLVAGVTRSHLADAAGCSIRTVSRVVAWAVEVGLLVCVETGATAEFLGTETNRAPSYVLIVPMGAVSHAVVPGQRHGCADPAVPAVERLGNPPASSVGRSSPRRDQGLTRRSDQESPAEPGQPGPSQPWPVFDRARTSADRARATDTLLDRAGLGGRVVRWRARAMFGPWFEAGWSVLGLLHALDHHPDRPEASRGDATRAARDPLRVLGHRLAPWRGRLDELPAALHAVDAHARRTPPAVPAGTREAHERPRASAETRTAARAELARALARPRWSR